MNRVKIMFAAIAVVAIVGGALAFKAKTFNGQCIYSKPGDECALVGSFVTTNEGGTLLETTGTYITRIGNCPATQAVANCNATFSYKVEE
jgi:hypothetical protein